MGVNSPAVSLSARSVSHLDRNIALKTGIITTHGFFNEIQRETVDWSDGGWRTRTLERGSKSVSWERSRELHEVATLNAPARFGMSWQLVRFGSVGFTQKRAGLIFRLVYYNFRAEIRVRVHDFFGQLLLNMKSIWFRSDLGTKSQWIGMLFRKLIF